MVQALVEREIFKREMNNLNIVEDEEVNVEGNIVTFRTVGNNFQDLLKGRIVLTFWVAINVPVGRTGITVVYVRRIFTIVINNTGVEDSEVVREINVHKNGASEN